MANSMAADTGRTGHQLNGLSGRKSWRAGGQAGERAISIKMAAWIGEQFPELAWSEQMNGLSGRWEIHSSGSRRELAAGQAHRRSGHRRTKRWPDRATTRIRLIDLAAQSSRSVRGPRDNRRPDQCGLVVGGSFLSVAAPRPRPRAHGLEIGIGAAFGRPTSRA